MIILKDWKKKPEQWGPLKDVQLAVMRNAERLGIDPSKLIAIFPFWQDTNTYVREVISGARKTFQGTCIWVKDGLKFDSLTPTIAVNYSLDQENQTVILRVTPNNNSVAKTILQGSTGGGFGRDAITYQTNETYRFRESTIDGSVSIDSPVVPVNTIADVVLSVNSSIGTIYANGNAGSTASSYQGFFDIVKIVADTAPNYFTGTFSSLILLNQGINHNLVDVFNEQPYYLLQANGAPLFFDILPVQEEPATGTTVEFSFGATETTNTTDIDNVWQFDLTSPTDTQTDVSVPPTLTWGTYPGTANYNLQVATDASFNDMVINLWTTNRSYEASELAGLTDYYWRVRAAA